MKYTVPNQRIVTIHREAAKSDFLGIRNENWQYAARDLGAHALMLYLYLASNKNGYTLALSPAAIRETIGMARSTFYDQFLKLVQKGYLVPSSTNGFDFFEVPQTRREVYQNSMSSDGLDFEECTRGDSSDSLAVQPILSQDIEINNMDMTDKTGINISGLELNTVVKVPEVKEIHIPVPERKGKKEILPKPQKKEFIF